MTHKYNLGDEVILYGRIDGVRFNNDVCTIVALRHPEDSYKYLVKVKDLNGRSFFHQGHIDTDEVTSYLPEEFESTTYGTLLRSNSGNDRYNISEKIIVGLNVKDYDPKQQPYTDDDI